MNAKRATALFGFALVAAASLWIVLGGPTPPGAGHEGDDEQPLRTVEQPQNLAELEIALGLRDTQQAVWEGEIKVSQGRVLEVQILQAARNATADDARFSVRAARQPAPKKQAKKKKKQAGLQPARLRVLLDAPESAAVTVATSRGDFSFVLSELPAGEPKTFLEGQASVARQEGAVILTRRETEDDYPAIARAADGAVWLALVSYTPGPPIFMERIQNGDFAALEPRGNGDRIRLMRFDGHTWREAPSVTEGGLDVWRPTVAVDGQGGVWVAWAQKADGDWEVFARRYAPAAQADQPGQWSDAVRLTNARGSDFHTVAATDSKGRVWLAWQAFRNGNYDILLSSAGEDGRWSEPKTISPSAANDWRPANAADSQGAVYVARDTYDKGNSDVRLHVAGPQSKTITVADSPRFEARPHLYCDEEDRLWIAYEEGDEQWGKDYANQGQFRNIGLTENPAYALYINRTVRVKCLDHGQWRQPAGSLEAAFEPTLTRNKSLPRLAGDGQGGLWLLVRHHPLPGGAGEVWHSYALRYRGGEWTRPRHLTHSANLLDNRPALAPHNGGLLVVYSGDGRTRTQDRDQTDLFAAVLTADEEPRELELTDVPPDPPAELEPYHPHEEADVARMRDYRLKYGGKELRLYRGEFHRHTEFTAHRDGDGLLEDAWRYALDAGRLDWMGDGDHDNGFGHEYMWWLCQKITDLHHNPPHFTAVMSYERSNVYPNGHRNVILPRRGIRPLPRGDLAGTPEEGTPDTKLLYAYLKHFGGICASHTSATNMGTDWRDNDPEVEPVVEIYQGHRHNYEHFAAPRAPTAETQIGGYRPAGFVWNALEKGYRLGFQSSSDHISTHMSYAVVLAEEGSPPALIDAFKRRHCYAATDNILLIVRSGEHLMGDAFTTRERPRLTIEVHGTQPIARLHVIRNNQYLYSIEPNEVEVRRTFTDMDPEPGRTSYYYVRVEQSDGNLAWASPMWITYAP